MFFNRSQKAVLKYNLPTGGYNVSPQFSYKLLENEIYFENSLTFSGLGFGGLGCNPIITEQAKVLLKWCLDTVFENYQKKSHFQNFVPSGRCLS